MHCLFRYETHEWWKLLFHVHTLKGRSSYCASVPVPQNKMTAVVKNTGETKARGTLRQQAVELNINGCTATDGSYRSAVLLSSTLKKTPCITSYELPPRPSKAGVQRLEKPEKELSSDWLTWLNFNKQNVFNCLQGCNAKHTLLVCTELLNSTSTNIRLSFTVSLSSLLDMMPLCTFFQCRHWPNSFQTLFCLPTLT